MFLRSCLRSGVHVKPGMVGVFFPSLRFFSWTNMTSIECLTAASLNSSILLEMLSALNCRILRDSRVSESVFLLLQSLLLSVVLSPTSFETLRWSELSFFLIHGSHDQNMSRICQRSTCPYTFVYSSIMQQISSITSLGEPY